MPLKEEILSILRFRKTTGFAVVVALVLAELALRGFTFGFAAFTSPLSYDPVSLVETANVVPFPDRKLAWRLRSSVVTQYKGQAFATNAHGFRDRERAVVAEPGQSRIAVLGRSYEMGTGVADSQTWPALLEREFFQNHHRNHNKVEVLNFGVEAYSWQQVEATFHRFAKNFRPSCVLLPVFYEEIDTLIPTQAQTLRPAGFSLVAWAEHFYLPRVAQQGLWWLVFRHGGGDWLYFPRGASRPHAEGAMVTAEPFITVIQRLVASIRSEGMDVAILPLPRLIRTSDHLYEKGRRLFELFARSMAHATPQVSLLQELESLHQAVGLQDVAIPGETHFGAAFNQTLAEKTFLALKKTSACRL